MTWLYILAGVWIGMAMAVIITMCRHAPLCDEDGNDIEAIARATREEHPGFADWDTRELTK